MRNEPSNSCNAHGPANSSGRNHGASGLQNLPDQYSGRDRLLHDEEPGCSLPYACCSRFRPGALLAQVFDGCCPEINNTENTWILRRPRSWAASIYQSLVLRFSPERAAPASSSMILCRLGYHRWGEEHIRT